MPKARRVGSRSTQKRHRNTLSAFPVDSSPLRAFPLFLSHTTNFWLALPPLWCVHAVKSGRPCFSPIGGYGL